MPSLTTSLITNTCSLHQLYAITSKNNNKRKREQRQRERVRQKSTLNDSCHVKQQLNVCSNLQFIVFMNV